VYHKQKQGNCTADIRQLYPACHIGWSHRFHVGLPYGQNFPEYRLADRIADPDKISRMHYNAEIRDQGGILPQHYIQRAWVAFQTAYLKANYPSEYMAAVLSRNLSDITKLTIYMDECKAMGITVKGPDVNESFATFGVNAHGDIRFGLSAIKGIGGNVVRDVLAARDSGGEFKDIYDFVERVPSSALNRPHI